MHQCSFTLYLLLGVSFLAGCATPYIQGQSALRQGHYDQAASSFKEVLASDPGRVDALAGLGISRYKSGAFQDAVDTLQRVAALAPKDVEARLYLGLSYLGKGEDGLADEHLSALLRLKPHPRLAAQLDRALRVIRVDQPLSEEMRAFLAASLEDEAEWAQEVREARYEARWAMGYPYWYPYRCFVTRHGFVRCF